MYEKTLSQLKSKISSADTLDKAQKDELLTILTKLDNEVEALSKEDDETATTIANFAQTSTHEAARTVRNNDLVDVSLTGLKKSIEGFEASHPALTEAVNKLSVFLSNMGI